uniref:Uncharacterized protein n=1 Tax=Anguilla anguilla TaxID=7936 RepID=A0A0E9WRD4_ANGAN
MLSSRSNPFSRLTAVKTLIVSFFCMKFGDFSSSYPTIRKKVTFLYFYHFYKSGTPTGYKHYLESFFNPEVMKSEIIIKLKHHKSTTAKKGI